MGEKGRKCVVLRICVRPPSLVHRGRSVLHRAIGHIPLLRQALRRVSHSWSPGWAPTTGGGWS